MMTRRCLAALGTLLLLAGCGQTAQTATPETPAANASPQAAPMPATPTPSAAPQIQDIVSSYSAERTKELVAEGFYLPGMQYGAGKVPQYGGRATFANRGDLRSSDPMFFSGINNDNILSSIHGDGGLVRAKESNIFEPEPYLAESWTAEDNFKSWTFKLRPDVKWHDGTPFTAEDVKFLIDLAVFPPQGRRTANNAADYGSLKEVLAVDNLTVRLVEKEPVPHLLETVVRYSNVMSHPRHLAKPKIEAGNVNVAMNDLGWVSVGPFKYDSYEKASSFTVIRFDQYFLGDNKGRALPYLDSVFYPVIPDPTVGVSAFRAGRLDGTSRGTGHHLTPNMVTQVKKTFGEKAWFMRLPYTGWGGGTNALKAPFDDIRLRQAVNLYTDRQEHMRLVYGGFAIESDLMVPGSYWTDPGFPAWPGMSASTKAQDQADGKTLIKEAGLEGAPIAITCADVFLQNCEFLELQLKGLGLSPRIEILDQVSVNQRVQEGNFQVVVATIGAENPDQALLAFVTTNRTNANKHGDARIDEYHQRIVATVDPSERRQILWEGQRYLIQEKAYLQPWPREEAVIAYRSHIKGLWVTSAQVHYLNDMGTTWIDR